MEEKMKNFDGEDQHEWPDFAKKLLAIVESEEVGTMHWRSNWI